MTDHFERDQITCPRCHKIVMLRKDGSISSHTNTTFLPEYPGASFSQRCPGSGITPAERAVDSFLRGEEAGK